LEENSTEAVEGCISIEDELGVRTSEGDNQERSGDESGLEGVEGVNSGLRDD
jgi:hypothetical protein